MGWQVKHFAPCVRVFDQAHNRVRMRFIFYTMFPSVFEISMNGCTALLLYPLKGLCRNPYAHHKAYSRMKKVGLQLSLNVTYSRTPCEGNLLYSRTPCEGNLLDQEEAETAFPLSLLPEGNGL